MRTRRFILTLLASTAISSQSQALDASGETVGVNPDAEATGVGGVRIIEIKGPIFMGDVITTDLNGQVQILFVDETKFIVGANSKVTIDAFVFDANKTAQDVSISAVKGAFRFITGNSPKQNYTDQDSDHDDRRARHSVRPCGQTRHRRIDGADARRADRHLRCHPSMHGRQCRKHDRGVRAGAGIGSPGLDRNQRLSAFFPLLGAQGLAPGFAVQVPATTDLGIWTRQFTA